MRKLRTGLEKRITYNDSKEYKNIILRIKVITKLIEKQTNKEIIFLDYEKYDKTEFRCKIPNGIGKISFKNSERFFSNEELENYLHYDELLIDSFVKIVISDNNVPKIELNKELLKTFPFRIEYNVEYGISNYWLNEKDITEEKHTVISKEEFIKALNDLEKKDFEIGKQKAERCGLCYYDTEI